MSADPNRLLFVVSARGQMKWRDYCEAVDFLSANYLQGKNDIRLIANRGGLLQCLEALGHCDTHYSDGQSTIIITRPSLCRLPRAGLPVAVLTGARLLNTQEQLMEAAESYGGAVRIEIQRCPGPLGQQPDTILIESESEDTLVEFAANQGLYYAHIPPAWSLVNWSGSLSEYEECLTYSIQETLNWTRYDFCVQSHVFKRTPTKSLPRFSRYLNPTTGLPMHVFFRDNHGAEVELNWGRYLLLRAKGITVSAYDEERYRLCVPVRTPLPSVIARSVCLCSGKPPVYHYRGGLVHDCGCKDWLLFDGVPPQIAVAALSKLGLSPVKVEIR